MGGMGFGKRAYDFYNPGEGMISMTIAYFMFELTFTDWDIIADFYQ